MISYNSDCCFKDANGYVYSCDNVRLSAYVRDDEESESDFHRFFDDPKNLHISDVITTHTTGKFRHLWNISCKKTSYTVLHWFNGFDNFAMNRRKVVIDFNPNKLEYDELREISILMRSLTDVQIVRCDLAIDIPIDRQFVHLIKDNRNYVFQDHNENGITEYLGVRNNSNFVKVYDKTRESSLDEAITRVELTCEPLMTEFIKHFPAVLIEHEQLSLELLEYEKLSKTQLSFVSVLKTLNVPERMKALNALEYRMRKKLSPYVLADTYRLEVDNACVSNVFRWLLVCVHNNSFTQNNQP